MLIIMSSITRTDTSTSATFTCGKHSAYIAERSIGGVNVCILNASHRAWRGMGKCFTSWEAAEAGYKSEAVKEMLRVAQRCFGEKAAVDTPEA